MLKMKPRDFRQISELLSLIPLSTGKKIRYEFYRKTLKGCGENVTVHFGTVLVYRDITLGNNVSLGTYNTVGLVDMGNNILTANHCTFLSGRHTHQFDSLDVPISKQSHRRRRISIGDDVWVGSHCVVMESIGDGCVLGAGSVVTKPVESYSVVAGNPARVIKKRGV